MPELNCRHFSGYKPCGLNDVCDPTCSKRSLVKSRVLLVHLEAYGAVVRSTALLPAIRRKYPDSHITWVTKSPCHLLIQNIELVDRVLTTSAEDLVKLVALRFDVVLVVDKSLSAIGIAKSTKYSDYYGFASDESTGAIVPATPAAEELWSLGLDNHKKFFINKKPETQLAAEALELPYRRDDYLVAFSKKESATILERRKAWSPKGEILIGLNTGCSNVIPYKKLSVEAHREIIKQVLSWPKLKSGKSVRCVLLGGPEDTERNIKIAEGLDVISTPTTSGLRDGYVSMAACDIITSGDSLGLHMAVALKKWVVAWFGPTCVQEIDLYDRGVSVLTSATCSPCWKRSCDKNPMCYDLVDLKNVIEGIQKGIEWLDSSSKPHSLGMHF